MPKREFQTEVSQLLQLIVHSLYSHPEIFLRELISNSSDALDKLRHLTLTEEAYKALPFDPRIDLELDEEKKTLTIADTGIGMNEEDLTSNLGTIARSGTKNFLSQLSGDARKDTNLIGQFGVGFYSAFMVADKVEVVSRKAGEDQAWRWTSDGKTGFDIEPAERASSTPIVGACRRSSRNIPITLRFLSSSPTTRASGTRRRRNRSRPGLPNRLMPQVPCGAAPRAN